MKSLFSMMIFRRGSLLSTAIFVYAATSPVNGYFGGGLYSRMGGKLWIRQVHIVLGNIYYVPYNMHCPKNENINDYFHVFQMLTAAFLLPLLVCGTAFFINFIAMGYHASRAIPFGTMVCNKWIISYTSCRWKYYLISVVILINIYFDLGRCSFNLHFCDFTIDPGWDGVRPKFIRCPRLPMSSERST